MSKLPTPTEVMRAFFQFMENERHEFDRFHRGYDDDESVRYGEILTEFYQSIGGDDFYIRIHWDYHGGGSWLRAERTIFEDDGFYHVECSDMTPVLSNQHDDPSHPEVQDSVYNFADDILRIAGREGAELDLSDFLITERSAS